MSYRAADPDDITLVHAIRDKLDELRQSHVYYRGTDLIVPKDLQTDYQRFLQLHERFCNADYRISQAEYMSMQMVANWSVSIFRQLRNQPSN